MFKLTQLNALRLTAIIFVFVSTLIFSPALSQTELTLQEAIKIAKEQNLKLLQQQENQKTAELEKSIQSTNRLPSLNLSLSSTYLSEINVIDISKVVPAFNQKVELGGHDRSELILSLQQPIFTGFRLQSLVELAKNTQLSEKAKLDVITNEICHTVYLLFYQSQNLSNQRKILTASLRRLDIQLENVRNLFEAAQVMAFDTLQVYNQKLSIQIEMAKTLSNQRLVNLQVARLLNLAHKVSLAELQMKKPEMAGDGIASLKNTAHQNRPELQGIRIAKSSVGLQQKLARSTYFPTIYATGNFHYAKPGLDPVNNKWMNYYSAGINLQWNLWRWGGDQKKVQKTKVLFKRLTLEERELIQTVNYQVEESFENLQFSLEQLRLAEELQTQQKERYRILSVQHRNGVATTNELITAETDLTRAESQTQLALVQYYVYLADLKRDIGTISDNL